MKQISFIIIVVILTIILFGMLKYATDESIFENMTQGRFMILASIVNDESPSTSNFEKISAIKKLNISDPKIKDIIDDSNSDNDEKLKRIKGVIKSITL